MHTSTNRFALALTIAGAIAFHPDHAEAQPGAPLYLFFSDARQDNFSTATTAGVLSALQAGYRYVRQEGYLPPSNTTGLAGLSTYWHGGRADNFTFATAAGLGAAISSGYQPVRLEGFVHASVVAGTNPLFSFWNPGRGDNFTASSLAAVTDAVAAGYQFVRTEGYVAPTYAAACGGTGNVPATTVFPEVIRVAQTPGRQLIGYPLQNGWDALLIIVDDDSTLAPNQVRVTIDVDAPTVAPKAIEAWSECHQTLTSTVVATHAPAPLFTGLICPPNTAANNFSNGCSVPGSMVINLASTSELRLRKPNVVGVWFDAEVLDPSLWLAFAGRAVRFFWRFD